MFPCRVRLDPLVDAFIQISANGRSPHSWDCKLLTVSVWSIRPRARPLASSGRHEFLSIPTRVSRSVSSNRGSSILSHRCWPRWSTTGGFLAFLFLSLRPLISSTASCNNYLHRVASITGDSNDRLTSHPTVTSASTLGRPHCAAVLSHGYLSPSLDVLAYTWSTAAEHVFPRLQLCKSFMFILRK
jgi:hypothetical protein